MTGYSNARLAEFRALDVEAGAGEREVEMFVLGQWHSKRFGPRPWTTALQLPSLPIDHCPRRNESMYFPHDP